MKNNKFDSEELEDLEFCLSEFEKKYKIRFTQDELNSIAGIEQLTETISNKFDYENSDDCTTQQAFYKLRNVLNKLNIGSQSINRNTELTELIPRKNRIQKVRDIEKELGFKLDVLRPKNIVKDLLIFLSLSTLILAFYHFFYALILGICLYSVFDVIFKNGKEFKILTLGELANKMVLNHYFNVRRNKNTINKIEFKNLVLEWFSDRMDMSKEELKSAKFI